MTRPQVEQYLTSSLVRYKGGGVADDLFGRDHESIQDMAAKVRMCWRCKEDIGVVRDAVNRRLDSSKSSAVNPIEYLQGLNISQILD